MTLTEFLLARIAEDEAVAREVGDEMIAMFNGPRTRALDINANRSWEIRPGMTYEADPTGDVEVHPARVLAECEAKRRIVVEAAKWQRIHTEAHTYMRADDAILLAYQAKRSVTGDMLRLLTLPYAEHPDYRPEWRP